MHPAALDEAALLSVCDTRRQRRSGPGGQHRNKAETAVVITHRPTGIQGEASERRSQAENLHKAVFRLRINLALELRQPCPLDAYRPSPLWSRRCRGGRLSVNSAHAEFPPLLAEALDVLAACELDAATAARHLACSPSQLVRLLASEPRALTLVNRQRQALGLHPYR